MNRQQAIQLKKDKHITPAEQQFTAIANYPCSLHWSNGTATETTLNKAFCNEDSYKRYLGYKQSGKPYPIKIEAVEPAEPAKASSIFPQGTAGDEYQLVNKMCEDFTTALSQYITQAERSGDDENLRSN